MSTSVELEKNNVYNYKTDSYNRMYSKWIPKDKKERIKSAYIINSIFVFIYFEFSFLYRNSIELASNVTLWGGIKFVLAELYTLLAGMMVLLAWPFVFILMLRFDVNLFFILCIEVILVYILNNYIIRYFLRFSYYVGPKIGLI